MKYHMNGITSMMLALSVLAGCTAGRPIADISERQTAATATAENRMIKELKAIPSSYAENASEQGRVVQLDYTTTDYENPDRTLQKYAYIYLPYGFDAANTDIRYDVLYLLHGGSGDAERYFGGAGQSSPFKRILDHMIQNDELRPMMVVTPTFYPIGNTDASVSNTGEAVAHFPAELVNDLIPAVESAYPTYARTIDAAGLVNSRNHRGFGGFSMGSVATWYTFMDCLDYFRYYLPMSGDCWTFGQRAGGSDPKGTADALAQSLAESGYGAEDFFIYVLTGDEDIAYSSLAPQMEAMKTTDGFIFSPDINHGNFYFSV